MGGMGCVRTRGAGRGDELVTVGTRGRPHHRGSGMLTGVTAVGAGADHSCARHAGGSAWSWGRGQYGQLGDGTNGDPVTHSRLRAVRVSNGLGQLGRGSRDDDPHPYPRKVLSS